MSRTMNYVFTVNNYKDADIDAIRTADWIKWCVVGKETGATGTKHLQGALSTTSRTRATTVGNKLKKLVAQRPHIEVMRGTPAEAANYCKKDGDYVEWGEMPATQGARTDIAEMYEAVASGKTELEIAEAMPDCHAKYFKAAERYRKLLQNKGGIEAIKARMAGAVLKQWQREVVDLALNQGSRQITWVVDLKGNSGKSWLAEWMIAHHNAFVCDNAKSADIAHAYDAQPVVIFDYTRSQAEYVNYSILEALKNGRIFAPKYESSVRHFKAPVVLCFSNWLPDRAALSEDRWFIYELTAEDEHEEEDNDEDEDEAKEAATEEASASMVPSQEAFGFIFP